MKNELRIGNIITDIHASDQFFAQVKELRADVCYYGLFKSKYQNLKPVPLSEEWLIKCRRPYWLFKDHQDAYWFSFGGHKREIKFVHQLQNANYVLKGEELEFKL